MNDSKVRGHYTETEAAQLLGVGRSTMYELVHRSEVASIRLGRKVLITRSTLEALLGFTPPTPAELAQQQSRPTLDRQRTESAAAQLSLLE
jgi:excisionase family DNA binding protein